MTGTATRAETQGASFRHFAFSGVSLLAPQAAATAERFREALD